MTEAEKKLEAEEHREDSHRRDSEEMPVWAADMMKKMDSMHSRMDEFERKDSKERKDSRERRDSKDFGEDPTMTTEGKVKKDSEAEAETEKRQAAELEKLAKEEREEGKKEEERKDCRADESAKEEEHKAGEELAHAREKERADRARADATLARENRELKGKLEALESQVSRLYREPSYEDRNAIAEIRARADSVYQAVSGRPASDPTPGESPISYRKRLADGLRKYSSKFKGEQVGSLSGSAFDVVESQIYADAQAAAKTPEVMPKGQLRAITRNDSGHNVTEYIGDAEAAWAPFMAGAAMTVKLTKPQVH